MCKKNHYLKKKIPSPPQPPPPSEKSALNIFLTTLVDYSNIKINTISKNEKKITPIPTM